MFDLSLILSFLTSIVAIIVPTVSTALTNRNHMRLKQMELDHQYFTDITIHKREIFERYLKSIGKCIYSDVCSLSEYDESYFNALLLAPPDFRESMIKINEHMQNHDADNAMCLLESVIPELSEFLTIQSYDCSKR